MIDGAREGEVDAAYKVGVDETRHGDFVAIIECMRRRNGNAEMLFVDGNCAVHDDGAAQEGAYLMAV